MNSQMNIPQEEWDLIETYLASESKLDQSALLKDSIARIPDVENKIAHVKKITEEIKDNILKSKIKAFHGHVPDADKSTPVINMSARKSGNKVIWFAVAASLIFLIGLFWIMDMKSPSEKIFATHFRPDIGLPLKMSTDGDFQFYEGMLDYKQGNYPEAIAKWQILWKDNSESDTLNYFLGVAHLAEHDADQSLEYLENQALFKEGIFKEDAVYYAALAKIKKGQFLDAISLLEKHPSDRNAKLLTALKEQ